MFVKKEKKTATNKQTICCSAGLVNQRVHKMHLTSVAVKLRMKLQRADQCTTGTPV